jgi:hypothetical protein
MLAHLCFVLVVNDGLDEATATARGWAAAVEPDDRAVDVSATVWLAVVWLAVVRVPVVAAPAAVRLRATPPARTAAAMAVPASGRKIFTQFSLAYGSHPRPGGGRGTGRGGPPRPVRQAKLEQISA